MKDFKKIKSKLKKHYRYFWYLGSPSKVTLVAKGKKRREAKKSIYDKVNRKPDKFKGRDLIFIYLGFYSGKKILEGGQMSANISIFNVNDKLKIRDNSDAGQAGSVWFTKNYLQIWGWDYNYLKKIVELVYFKKQELLPLAITYYSSIAKKDKN
jgi:hypothetical protein